MHIYFHEDFDGVISAVLAARYFRDKHNDYDIHFHPVDYHIKHWESTALQSPSCVVDFKYHPNCDYWFDHHHDAGYEADKIREQYSDKYKLKEQKLYCDTQAKSCASLIHEKLFPNRGFIDLSDAADYIDAAQYYDADEACFGLAPSNRLNRLITNRILPLTEICKDLFDIGNIRSLMTREKYISAHQDAWYIECASFIQYMQKSFSCMISEIAEYQMINMGQFNRYLPFWEYPQCEYAVGLTGKIENNIRIAVGKNPWNNATSRLHVGQLCRRYGGGGHPDVGSIRVDSLIEAESIYDDVIEALTND